jgi:hypothetical protein
VHLVIDAVQPARRTRFWAAARRWEFGADPEGSEFRVLSPR